MLEGHRRSAIADGPWATADGMVMAGRELLEVRVKSFTYEAERFNSYDLRPPDGGELPPFKAGAHIDLKISMVHRLIALKRSWQLHCATRTRDAAAFLDELAALDCRKCISILPLTRGKVLNMAAIVNQAPADAN